MPGPWLPITSPLAFAERSVNTAVTVTTTATPIPIGGLNWLQYMVLYNNSGAVIYIGGSNVTVANGIPLEPRSYLMLNVSEKFPIYVVVPSGTAELRVWAFGI